MADRASSSLLVATPRAPRALRGTVVLLGMRGPEGALGWILNRPLSVSAREVLGAFGMMGREKEVAAMPFFAGGYEHTHSGWLLFDRRGDATLPPYSLDLGGSVGLTVSPEAFADLLARPVVPAYHLVRGYVGWAPGQLAAEIGEGAWMEVEADASIVFDVQPERRFAAALETQGVSAPLLGELVFAEA